LTQIGFGGFSSLSVKILPDVVATASNLEARGQWRLPDCPLTDWHDSEEVVSNLSAGLHLVEFKSLDAYGFEGPASQFLQVAPNETVIYGVTYRRLGSTGLDKLDFTTITNGWQAGLPYAFSGQLVSDVGFGSGF